MKTLRITVMVLMVVVLLGIGVRLALPTLLIAAVNRQFALSLSVPAKLTSLRLGLLDGRVLMQGLTVSQPAGFGRDLLLDLPEVKITMAIRSLFGSPLTIDEVMITDATIHLIRDTNDRTNVACLFRQTAARPAAASSPKPIHIRKITVRNLTVQYTDFTVNPKPMDLHLNHGDAVITNVYLDPAHRHDPALAGSAELTAHLIQPGFSAAPLGIVARFGYLEADQPIPAVNAALRLAGVELQPWQTMIPPGMMQTLGGDILDVSLDVVMTVARLDCTVAMETPAGNALSLKVGGTPFRPQVNDGSLRGLLGDRAGEAGLNTLKNVAGTGEELGRTALSSGVTAGAGAGKLLTGIATGLFKTVFSAAKGNLPAAGGNLLKTAAVTLPNSANLIGHTGASLWHGAGKTGSAALGGDRVQVWRGDIERRWAKSWEAAGKSIAQKPLPVLASARPQ